MMRLPSSFRVLALAGVALAVASEAQSQQCPAGGIKIAFVNGQSVLQNASGYDTALANFNKEVEGFKAQLTRLQGQIDSAAAKFEEKSVMLTPQQRRTEQVRLDSMQTAADKRQNELRQKAQDREQELLDPIRKRVQAVLDGIRAECSLWQLLDAAVAPIVVSYDPASDLTQLAIARLKASGGEQLRRGGPDVMASRPLTAQAVADMVGGRLSGPGDIPLRRVRSLELAEGDALSMCIGQRWVAAMAQSRAGAVLVTDAFESTPGPATRIVVKDPARALNQVARSLQEETDSHAQIDATVRIGKGTNIGPDAGIGPYAVIGNGVKIGERARLGPHVVIEDNVELGDDVRLDAQVVVYSGSILGSRVWCKAGSIIGGAGFGFDSGTTGHTRIPQGGNCIIGDDVEIGSVCSIDRGSLDDTVIGRGTKLDNQVHVGHNVHIGTDCLIVGGVLIGGSTRIGDRVLVAGKVGISNNLEIGDDVRIGAGASVIRSVAAGVAVSGYPARPHREFLKGVAATYRLEPHAETLEAMAKERENA